MRIKVRRHFLSCQIEWNINSVLQCNRSGGAEGNRTPGLIIANDALSQLSYGPVPIVGAM